MASGARRAFLERLAVLRRAVTSLVVVDLAPSAKTHNAQARLFRNGLSVIGFAILEDFIRSRSAEVLEWLTGCGLDYPSLPPRLQSAATRSTVKALGAQFDLRRRQGVDPAVFVSEVGRSFTSFTSTQTVFSDLMFGWRGSNLGVDEVPEILGAFGVRDGWANIERIGRRGGFGFLVARDAFVSAARLRHTSAHQVGANVQPTDLQFFARDAIGVALGFDTILSRGARLIASGASGATPEGVLLADRVRVRFLEKHGSTWRERVEGRSTTVRRDSSYQRIEGGARRRASTTSDVIVVLDKMGQPYRWITTDVP